MTIKLLITIIFFAIIFSACSTQDNEVIKEEKNEPIKLENKTLEALGSSLIYSLKKSL